MRVGTRVHIALPHADGEDHPHACGDKSVHKAHYNFSKGSSPCVWGQADFKNLATSERRIIPMRVGTRTSTIGGTASG